MALKTILISEAVKLFSDESKRNTIIIIIVILVSLFMAIIFLPLFLILYPLETLKLYFMRWRLYKRGKFA